MHRNFNDLKTETMELKEKIEHYTHFITDQNKNEWKVVETSDLEDIMESYHQAKLKLLGIADVVGQSEQLSVAWKALEWVGFTKGEEFTDDDIQDIYKAILANGFTSKGQDVVNNKRLGIKRSFTNELGNYIEIYQETYGFSVFIYGGDFMSGYYPWNCDILFKKDIDHLRTKMETTLT